MPAPRKRSAAPFSGAHWIWPDTAFWDLHNLFARFRRTFEVERVPRRAPLRITADQSYQLWINDRFVCRGPARGFQQRWPYDELDVAPWLVRGRNVLAVRAYNPGRSTFGYLSQGWAGLLVALGGVARAALVSDRQWRCARERGVRRDATPASLQLCDVELVDARLDDEGWTRLDYDDAGWSPPDAVPLHERHGRCSEPWSALQPRGIPMLREWDAGGLRVVGVASGASVDGWRDARNPFEHLQREMPTHVPADGDGSLLRVEPTGPGRFRSWVLDLGRAHVGNFEVHARGAAGGESVDIVYAEAIDPASRAPVMRWPAGCKAAFAARIVLRPGETRRRLYHPYGFRCAAIVVREATHPLEVALTLRCCGYPLERQGAFECSDGDLQRIWEVCAWTQQVCMMDAYVDTPWREQAQWWGDARVQAWNTFHLCDDARLLRRGIDCIAAQQLPNGLTYGHAPTMAHNCILPDFTLIWLHTLWDHYWQTGSTEAFAAHRVAVERALAYFRDWSDNDAGLLEYDPRYWLFLDWSGVQKEGHSSLYSLWLLSALQHVGRLYRLVRRPREAAATERFAARLASRLRRLIDPRTGLMRDGIARGRVNPRTGVQSQTLAMMCGLSPASERAMLDRVLLPYVRGESQPDAPPSSYWAGYVLDVLTQRGYGREVVEFIRARWRGMVEHGTTWEVFDARPGESSLSHAWSAHPLVHLMRTIGGVCQAGPAWSKVRFSPIAFDGQARVAIPTPRGTIRVTRGRREALRLPAGVRLVRGAT